MIQISQESKEQVLKLIHQGRIDAADISQPNFIDSILLKMQKMGLLSELTHLVEDKRRANAVIPLEFIWTLSIAAKMKIHTSLSFFTHVYIPLIICMSGVIFLESN